MAGVKLEFLGAAGVAANGEPVSGLGKKTIALLAYLAAPIGRFHNRDELAALLWTDRFDEQARQSLRQTLSTLRKALGDDCLVTDERGVALAREMAESDVAAFERLAASQEIDALIEARKLYRGEFLEGLPTVSEQFDEWANNERRRLRDLFAAALESLAQRQLEHDRVEDALATALALVAHDPTHEPAHRMVMQLHARQGRRSAALRQFEACKAALKRDLDVAPEAETIALAERIRRADDASAADAPERADNDTPSAPAKPSVAAPRNPLVLALSALALLAAAFVVFRIWSPVTEHPATHPCVGVVTMLPRPAIVVLPMKPGDESAEAVGFADMLTDRIGEMFNIIPGLTTVSGPPLGHADLRQSYRDLATDLGVTHVLDGDVRVVSGQVNVSIRLIDGATGELVWSNAYQSAGTDVELRDRIAIDVARAVQINLTEGPQALSFHQYENRSVRVLEHVMRGSEHLSQLTLAHNESARAEYLAALAIDSRDPPANSGVAWTLITDVLFGWSDDPQRDLALSERFANAAIESDPDYFYAHSLLGVSALLKGDHETAVALSERALQMSGRGADAAALHAMILSYTGDAEGSLELAQRAIRLRPYNSPNWYRWTLARASRLNGAPQIAATCLSASGARDDGALIIQIESALAASAMGDAGEARRLIAAARRQAGPALTAERYCAFPPYATDALTQRCVSDLRQAGLP